MHYTSIIDSHLHLWDTHQLHYPWLQTIPLLNRSFTFTELNSTIASLPIQGMVFIQAECLHEEALNEIDWVTQLAKKETRLKGIVAYAPLEKNEDMLAYLKILKKNSLVKGVRRIIQTEPNRFCLHPTFIENVNLLSELNLSFDLCVASHQLPEVIRLVEQCPKTKFVLDHLGKPLIAKKELHPWKDHLTTLSQFDHVWCKVSGMITEANHAKWHANDLKPYFNHAIESFGFDRVMFGSDWPVLHLAGNYKNWVNTLYHLVGENREQDLKKLFYENAKKFYKLEFPR